MGRLGKIANRWRDVFDDDDDVNFELAVVKIPYGFPRITRCGGARTQGLSYEEPAMDSKESDKEDQRLTEESSSGLAPFEDSENSGVRQKMPVLRHLPNNNPFFSYFLFHFFMFYVTLCESL